MSNFPTQKGTQVYPQTMKRPIVVRIKGVDRGSQLAAAVVNFYRGALDQFVYSQQQQYGLSIVPIQRGYREIDGARMQYTNLDGQEIVNIEVPTRLLEELDRELVSPPGYLVVKFFSEVDYAILHHTDVYRFEIFVEAYAGNPTLGLNVLNGDTGELAPLEMPQTLLTEEAFEGTPPVRFFERPVESNPNSPYSFIGHAATSNLGPPFFFPIEYHDGVTNIDNILRHTPGDYGWTSRHYAYYVSDPDTGDVSAVVYEYSEELRAQNFSTWYLDVGALRQTFPDLLSVYLTPASAATGAKGEYFFAEYIGDRPDPTVWLEISAYSGGVIDAYQVSMPVVFEDPDAPDGLYDAMRTYVAKSVDDRNPDDPAVPMQTLITEKRAISPYFENVPAHSRGLSYGVIHVDLRTGMFEYLDDDFGRPTGYVP